jgi:hypothetical protein
MNQSKSNTESQILNPSKEKELWNAQEYASITNQLLAIANRPEVNIEIELIGNWLWVSGDTKPVKNLIQAIEISDLMKCKFMSKKEKWAFHPANWKKKGKRIVSHQAIRDYYGTTKIEEQHKIAV